MPYDPSNFRIPLTHSNRVLCEAFRALPLGVFAEQDYKKQLELGNPLNIYEPNNLYVCQADCPPHIQIVEPEQQIMEGMTFLFIQGLHDLYPTRLGGLEPLIKEFPDDCKGVIKNMSEKKDNQKKGNDHGL